MLTPVRSAGEPTVVTPLRSSMGVGVQSTISTSAVP